jgi:Methane oxygenase PmoA
MKLFYVVGITLIAHSGYNLRNSEEKPAEVLTLRYDQSAETISVFRNDQQLLLTQNVKSDIRPYIHPIIAPDGNGVLTEFSPAHHKHQTGLYWGLKKVNGRDYFMNWKGDYWRRTTARVIEGKAPKVKWQHVYDLIDEKGSPILTETQTWSMHESDGKYLLDLEWRGEAKTDVTMEKFYVGGLFLRMPWHQGIGGEVINSEGNRNDEAEGQRAMWNDIGLEIDGRRDKAHIVILDHPDNADFPSAWRVDNEFGIGPSRQILGDWSIQKGKSAVIRYRLVVYTGEFSNDAIARLWKEYTGNK